MQTWNQEIDAGVSQIKIKMKLLWIKNASQESAFSLLYKMAPLTGTYIWITGTWGNTSLPPPPWGDAPENLILCKRLGWMLFAGRIWAKRAQFFNSPLSWVLPFMKGKMEKNIERGPDSYSNRPQYEITLLSLCPGTWISCFSLTPAAKVDRCKGLAS